MGSDAGSATERLGPAMAMGVAAIVLWGASPVATALAVDRLDPLLVGMLRTVLPALLMLPLLSRMPFPAGRGDRALLAASSAGGFVVFPVLFSLGMQQTSTAHAALIIAASPVVTGIVGAVAFRAVPRRLWWIGAAIALSGEALLILSRSGGSVRGEATLTGDLLVAASVLGSATSYVTGGRLAARIGSWPVTAWGVTLAAAAMLPALPFRARGVAWAEVGPAAWAGVLYLAIAVSVVGYVLWYRAIGIAGVSRIAPIQFAQPLVGIGLGLLVFSERITPQILAAMAAILAGMAVTQRAARLPAPVPPPTAATIRRPVPHTPSATPGE